MQGVKAIASPARKPGHVVAARVLAASAVAVSAPYLYWRLTDTIGGPLGVLLWLLELWSVLGLVVFTWGLWSVEEDPPVPDASRVTGRVALLITTYNESPDILAGTIVAARDCAHPHETWVLDDGDRPEVRDLATRLGVDYLARPSHEHAKAGNLNHALSTLDVDFVGVLDADHVVSDDFLTHTLGYFVDPRLAVVQTPQEFYNADSFEHDRNRSLLWARRRTEGYAEQRLFYRAISPGKNRFNAAFWCGTNAVLRVEALRSVGGVATESLTEDIHTSIRLHKRGWRTYYRNEALAWGLAARNAAEYQSQRLRWGTGAMEVWRRERLWRSPLTLSQKLAYSSTLLGWFDAWRTLGYALLPAAVVITGVSPIVADWRVFVPAFLLVTIVQRLALSELSRGYAPSVISTVFEFVRLDATLRATWRVWNHRAPRTFAVTAKDASSARQRVDAPWALVSLLVVDALALGRPLAAAAGWAPEYGSPGALVGGVVFLVLNAAFTVAAIGRIRGPRYASDRRGAARRAVNARLILDGQPARLVDLSATGAGAVTTAQLGDHVNCELLFPGGDRVALGARVVARRELAGFEQVLGLRFDEHAVTERAEIARVIYTVARRSRRHAGAPA